MLYPVNTFTLIWPVHAISKQVNDSHLPQWSHLENFHYLFRWLAYIKDEWFFQESQIACVFAIEISIYIVWYRSLQSSEKRKNKVTVAHISLAEQFQSWLELGVNKIEGTLILKLASNGWNIIGKKNCIKFGQEICQRFPSKKWSKKTSKNPSENMSEIR